MKREHEARMARMRAELEACLQAQLAEAAATHAWVLQEPEGRVQVRFADDGT